MNKGNTQKFKKPKVIIEDNWGSAAQKVGYWFEELVGNTFRDEGYTVSRKVKGKRKVEGNHTRRKIDPP